MAIATIEITYLFPRYFEEFFDKFTIYNTSIKNNEN